MTESFVNDASVTVDGNTITLPITGMQRFLSIANSDGSPLSISSIQVIDGALVIQVEQ